MTAIEIVEVSPRDGLQNDPSDMSTESKADLIVQLVSAGIRRVEVTSFVSPTAVPKMADAESLMTLLRGRELESARLMALVVNERGVARAAAAGVHEVNIVVVASDTFSWRNQGISADGMLDRLTGLVGAARDARMGASITVAAAFGCPFEGEISLGRLEETIGPVVAAQPDEIALADTIGVAVPTEVTERVGLLKHLAGPAIQLRAHFHDTRNTAIANAYAAIEAGVTALDTSLGGLGGCPFAPKATGNLATEDLAYALARSHVETGLDLPTILKISQWLAGVVDHPLPSRVARAGLFPP